MVWFLLVLGILPGCVTTQQKVTLDYPAPPSSKAAQRYQTYHIGVATNVVDHRSERSYLGHSVNQFGDQVHLVVEQGYIERFVRTALEKELLHRGYILQSTGKASRLITLDIHQFFSHFRAPSFGQPEAHFTLAAIISSQEEGILIARRISVRERGKIKGRDPLSALQGVLREGMEKLFSDSDVMAALGNTKEKFGDDTGKDEVIRQADNDDSLSDQLPALTESERITTLDLSGELSLPATSKSFPIQSAKGRGCSVSSSRKTSCRSSPRNNYSIRQ